MKLFLDRILDLHYSAILLKTCILHAFCCLWGLLLPAKAGGIDIPFRTFFSKLMEKEGCLGGNYAEKGSIFLIGCGAEFHSTERNNLVSYYTFHVVLILL